MVTFGYEHYGVYVAIAGIHPEWKTHFNEGRCGRISSIGDEVTLPKYRSLRGTHILPMRMRSLEVFLVEDVK